MNKKNFYDFTQHLGANILDERQKQHYSREQLAEKAEISPRYLYDLEKGESSPSAYVLHSIAHSLNVNMDYLIFDEYSMENGHFNPLFLEIRDNEKEIIIRFLKTIISLLE